MSEDFFCITATVLLVYLKLKSIYRKRNDNQKQKEEPTEPIQPNTDNFKKYQEEMEVAKAKRAIDAQKKRDIEYLRKQGYDDELIATILPIIEDK